MLQLGWKAGPEQYPPMELLDYAVAAEQAGFDTIDVSDHFHPWSEVGQAGTVRSKNLFTGHGTGEWRGHRG